MFVGISIKDSVNVEDCVGLYMNGNTSTTKSVNESNKPFNNGDNLTLVIDD